MKTIYCVTGASGHLGNNIVNKLIAADCTVRAFVLSGEPTFMIDEKAEIYYGNTCDKQSLEPFFTHNDEEEIVVIHCAAIVSITDKFDKRVFDVNVGGTKNVVDACLEYNVKKLVHIGSVHAIATEKNQVVTDCTVFDETKLTGNYAKSKAMAIRYVLKACDKGLNACILLPSGIIGVGDYNHNHLMELIKHYMAGKLPAAVKGEYDFVDVEDVADAAIAAVEKGRKKESYLINGEVYTIKQLLDTVSDCVGIKKMRTYLNLGFCRVFAPICEFYYRLRKKMPLFTKYSLEVLDSGDRFSHEKATRELGFSPKTLQQTVRNTTEWLLENEIVTIGKNMLPKYRKARRRNPDKTGV